MNAPQRREWAYWLTLAFRLEREPRRAINGLVFSADRRAQIELLDLVAMTPEQRPAEIAKYTATLDRLTRRENRVCTGSRGCGGTRRGSGGRVMAWATPALVERMWYLPAAGFGLLMALVACQAAPRPATPEMAPAIGGTDAAQASAHLGGVHFGAIVAAQIRSAYDCTRASGCTTAAGDVSHLGEARSASQDHRFSRRCDF